MSGEKLPPAGPGPGQSFMIMMSEPLARRKFFSRGLKLLGLVGAGGFGYSAFRFMAAGETANNPYLALVKPGPGLEALGKAGQVNPTSLELQASQVPPGESLLAAIGYVPVIVVREENGFKAFRAACSHLGCLVKWDPEAKEFKCPCHGGKFDRDGQVLAGPPPLALRRCKVEVKNERVKISLE